MTFDELKKKALSLPYAPGVYIMRDKNDKVIYVGKAKKLKNRVSQYFQDTASHNSKTKMMVSQVDRFDTILVRSEFEALVLENSLIKRHMPRFNILLKDDKGYPFVRLDESSEYPRFTLVTRPAQDGARYFGPFGGRHETRAAIEAALPADTAQDLYRILLTGETGEGGVHTDALKAALADRFYALELRDRTRLAEDLWAKAEEDSLRGLFLRDLKQQLAQAQTEEDRQRVTMAARFGLAALDHRDLG